MVSHALSSRRGTIRNPAVCKPSPPPPIEAEWPPEVMVIRFHGTASWPPPGSSFDETWNCPRQPATQIWFGESIGAFGRFRATWTLLEPTHKANLVVNGLYFGVGISAIRIGIDITWDVSSIYVITAWTAKAPAMGWSPTAVVTF